MKFVHIAVEMITRGKIRALADALGMKKYAVVDRALDLLATEENVSLSGSDGKFEATPFAKDNNREPKSQKAS